MGDRKMPLRIGSTTLPALNQTSPLDLSVSSQGAEAIS